MEGGDDNFDRALPDALSVEYRVLGAAWTPLAIPAGAQQFYWDPRSDGPIEARIFARDLAGNVGQATITVRPEAVK